MDVMQSFTVALFPWGKKAVTIDELVEATKRAEDLGFYSLATAQSLLLPDAHLYAGFLKNYVFEPMVWLPIVAYATKTIRFGVHSLVLPLLPPYFWAKYLATLDVVSGGRLIAGLCIGDGEPQFQAVGVKYKKRARISDEQTEVIVRLWTEEEVTHEGELYQLKDMALEPKPIQKPHPPIWWGGAQASIPRSARFAEYIVPPWPSVEEVRSDYVPRLREECKKWGTNTKIASTVMSIIDPNHDYTEDDLERWAGPQLKFGEGSFDAREVTIAGSPEQCAQRIKDFQEAGLDHFIFDFQRHGLDPIQEVVRQMELFVDKVVPLLK